MRNAFSLGILLLTAIPAFAVPMGELELTVENEPKDSSTHGYYELWVRIVNRSKTNAHEVRLTLPKETRSYEQTDYIRAVTRSVKVDPEKVARVALSYPERLPLNGPGIAVAIDGVTHDTVLMVSPHRSYSHYRSSRPAPMVLCSQGVDSRFFDWIEDSISRGREEEPGPPPAFSGPVSTKSGLISSPRSNLADIIRSDNPVAGWSPNWLGYSRYDGLVVTADDFRAMPGEVRTAVEQYIECGGSLLILGSNAPLPANWKPKYPIQDGLVGIDVGFGLCRISAATDLSKWEPPLANDVVAVWGRSLEPWQKERRSSEANRNFPVIDDFGVPVQGLLILMLVFAIGIGPVNLYVLTLVKRKLWLFITVPVMSLATCLCVFGYMAINEGWSGTTRIEGVTLLDENTRRATTLGVEGFYVPVLPSDGLHFSLNTEASYVNDADQYSRYPHRRSQSHSGMTIDWGSDQNFNSGWLAPRIPSHFVVRKSETRRERVTVANGSDGKPEAVNGLGVDLADLWYCDSNEKLFRAQHVPAGGKTTLSPAEQSAQVIGPQTFREMYVSGEWGTLPERLAKEGQNVLEPRMYMAVLDSAPFLDEGLKRAAVRKRRSVVFGILREGGDEN